MNKLTAEEIIQKFKDLNYSISEVGYGDIDTKEFGNIIEVDGNGGEGKGENWWRTYFFQDHDIYLKVRGWYSSYVGTEFSGWDAITEVSPKEKTITLYE